MTYQDQCLALLQWAYPEPLFTWRIEGETSVVGYVHRENGSVDRCQTPNLNSLDEIHMLERKLIGHEPEDFKENKRWTEFCYWLSHGTKMGYDYHANADERREALLRTLGLWKE